MKVFHVLLLVLMCAVALAPVAPARAREMPRSARPDGGTEGGGGGGLNGAVYAVAVSGANVYLGGDFTDAYGIPEADYIVKWNGSGWSALGNNGAGDGSLNAGVRAIAVSGGSVYVGGNFYNASNNGATLHAADYIAKWNGSNWSALGSNGAGNGSLNGAALTIAINGTDIYAGGAFTNVNNNGAALNAADYVAKWNGSNWSALGHNGAGNGSLNAAVNAIVTDGSVFYVGGSFVNVNNKGAVLGAADYVAKWEGSNWSALGGNGAGNGALNTPAIPSKWVAALALVGSDVYVGGSFGDVNNNGAVLHAADFIAKWDGTDWSALGGDGGASGSLNGPVYAINVKGSALYVGGGFTDVNNNGAVLGAADYFARWTGVNWLAVGDNGAGNGSLTGAVYSIAPGPYAAGEFAAVNNYGVLANKSDRIAYWSGSNWLSLPADISVSAFSLDFGEQKVGTVSAPMEVVVANHGKQNLVLGALTVSPHFGLSGDLCSGATIPGASSCSFQVNFAPTTSGIKTGLVSMPNNLPGSPSVITLDGTGIQRAVFRSNGAQDGWILETGENANQGGRANASAATLRLGDDAADKQYRAVLSFATGANLPDTAVITGITLKFKQQGVTGGGVPAYLFRGFVLDIRKGAFGSSALKVTDFQATPNAIIGPFTVREEGGWYTLDLPLVAKSYINKLGTGDGLTQVRLRFDLGDNDNAAANFLSIFSGDADAASRPQLIVEYYIP